MVTHDPKAAEQGARHDPPRKGRAGRLSLPARRAAMFVPLLILAQRVPAQAAHAAHDRRHRRRDRRLRPAAHGRRRLVRGRQCELERAARHAQRDLARRSRCRSPTRRRSARSTACSAVSWANWFGGVYITERNFFPQFAIDARDATSTCIPSSCSRRRSARRSSPTARARSSGASSPTSTAGRWATRSRCAARSIPGTWKFIAARHLRRRRTRAPTSRRCSFHWDYLNETIKKRYPRRGDQTGVFIVQLQRPGRRRPRCRAAIDATFKNSLAETLTETEKAFQLGFVAMTEAILLAIQAVSLRRHRHHHGGDGQHDGDDRARAQRRIRDAEGARLRQRLRRVADLRRVARHRAGRRRRSGIALTFPLAHAFAEAMGTLFPVFFVERGDRADAARLRRCSSASSRRRCRRGARRACASSTACARWLKPAVMTDSVFATSCATSSARKLTTVLTAGGMALVVYVFATVLMLAAGLEQTLVATGQDDNVRRDPPRRRRPRCRAASTARQAGDRREPAGHRDRRGRRASSSRRSRWCSSTCPSATRTSRRTS